MIVAWRVDPFHYLVTGGAISITSCRSHSSCAGKGAETSFPQHTPPKKSDVFFLAGLWCDSSCPLFFMLHHLLRCNKKDIQE